MTFNLHIANSFLSRMRGLSQRKSLAENEGMLIRFPFPFFWPIWMCGMRFPIDVLWLRHGKIVDIHSHISPSNSYRMHVPSRCADSCAELPAGTVQKHGLTSGTVMDFQVVDIDI